MTDINEMSNLGQAVMKLEARVFRSDHELDQWGRTHKCGARGGDLYVAMRMEAILSMEAG